MVDLGRLGPLSLGLIDEMADVCVVTTSGLPEMFEATRVLKKLGEISSANRLKLIFNRVPKGSSLSAADIEKALGMPVFAMIADCTGGLEDAYAAGHFLDEKLPLRKQIAQMAAKILGVDEKTAPGGMLGLVKLARSWMGPTNEVLKG